MTKKMENALKALFAYIDSLPVDKRIKYMGAGDTETLGSLSYPRFYDLGFAIIDRKGRIYFKVSLVNSTIYYGHKDEMNTCYYAHKLPQYEVEIANGERTVLDVWAVQKLVAYAMAHFDTNIFAAYNCGFDKRACNNTLRNFFPDGVVFYDIMLMAKDVIYPMASYRKFCEANGMMCKGKWSDRPKWSAECMYRFITKNPDFEEAHTGLRDVEIEAAILAACEAKHKKMRRELGTKKGK